MAPEVKSSTNQHQITNKADVWSLGAILYLLVVGDLNLFDKSEKDNQKVKDGKN